MGTTLEIDLGRRQSEAGWQATLDGFALRAVPRWFEWLGWVLALAALQYFEIKSRSIVGAVLLGISWGFLWLYFSAFFYRVKFKGLPFVRPSIERVVSIVLSGVLAYLSWWIARHLASLVAAQQAAG